MICKMICISKIEININIMYINYLHTHSYHKFVSRDESVILEGS